MRWKVCFICIWKVSERLIDDVAFIDDLCLLYNFVCVDLKDVVLDKRSLGYLFGESDDIRMGSNIQTQSDATQSFPSDDAGSNLDIRPNRAMGSLGKSKNFSLRKMASRRNKLMKSKAQSTTSLSSIAEHRDSLEGIKAEEPEQTFKRRARNLLLVSDQPSDADDEAEVDTGGFSVAADHERNVDGMLK